MQPDRAINRLIQLTTELRVAIGREDLRASSELSSLAMATVNANRASLKMGGSAANAAMADLALAQNEAAALFDQHLVEVSGRIRRCQMARRLAGSLMQDGGGMRVDTVR